MMKSSLEHMEAAIKELEDKVAAGEMTREVADAAIRRLRDVNERLNRLEDKLNAGPI